MRADAHPSTGPAGLPFGFRRAAFTMVEVVLAMALFATAVVVLAAAYVNVLTSLELVKVDQALEQEVSFVRTQVLLEPDRDTVEAGGEMPTASHGNATWQAAVEPTQVADLFRVVLTIELAGDGKSVPERTINQTLFVLRPDWSEPTERDNLRTETRKRLEEIKRFRPL